MRTDDAIWVIKGREFANCNCDFGCPCQFNARPTHGDCRAVLGFQIEEGGHGSTRLDGLKAVFVAAWPGAIHEGHGEVLTIIDERATEPQRQALLRIFSGQDTDPGASVWQVFSTTFEKVHDPLFAPIEIEIDVDARRATLRVQDVVDARCQPILNPITGAEHRVRIDMPKGFEFTFAEVGRGWAKSRGAVAVDLNETHVHFADLRVSSHGIMN